MLALQMNNVDWVEAELEINDGATTAQFYGSSVRMDVASVMDELVTWATSTFIPTFLWAWEKDTSTGGAILTLSATGNFTLEATNTDAQTGYGLNSGVKASASSHTFDSAAAGTWAPVSGVSVKANLRVLLSGDACGDGAVRPGVPGLAHYRPTVEAIGTALDAARLANVLGDASNPRRASICQQHTASWIEVAVGEVARNPAGAKHYRFRLEVSGEAV